MNDFITITRADHYPHEEQAYEPGAGPGIEHLDIDRMTVSVDQVVDGMVTIGVRGPDAHDAFGHEFDLTPGSALVLAERVSDAARRTGHLHTPSTACGDDLPQ